MSAGLPEFIDPWRAADGRVGFSGRFPLSGLARLAGLLADRSGDVVFRLAFSRDQEHRAVVHGTVAATLVIQCQRCLQPLAHQVDARPALAAVTDIPAARELPEEYDPLIAPEGSIRLRDIIEDELLLDLPQIPVHSAEMCTAVPDARPAQEARESPFAVLAEWPHG